MANYLDSWMQGDEPAVIDYMFKSNKLSSIVGDKYGTRIIDLSNFKYFNVDIYAASEKYLQTTYKQFYVPSEVNGEQPSSL